MHGIGFELCELNLKNQFLKGNRVKYETAKVEEMTCGSLG